MAHGHEKLRISFGHPTFDRTERATALLGTVQSSELVDLFERLGLTHQRQIGQECYFDVYSYHSSSKFIIAQDHGMCVFSFHDLQISSEPCTIALLRIQCDKCARVSVYVC